MSIFRFHTLLLTLLLAAGAVRPARAIPRFVTLDQLEVGEGQALPDEWAVITQKARIAGACGDDLFLLAGKDAVLSGRFENDVWVFADTLALSGKVRDHARLAGRTLEIEGSVDNGVTAVGGTVRFGPDSEVKGGVRVMAEQALLMGRIEGGARVRAASVTVSGRIAGDLDVETGDLVLLPGAQVDGALLYAAVADLTLPEGVTVTGGLVRRAPEGGAASLRARALMAAGLYMGALIVALVFILFLPRVAGDAARRLRRSYWTCLLTGLVAFPLFPILAGLAAVTGVGLALAGVLAAAGFLAFYLGHLAAALWLGSALLQRRGEQSFGSVFPALVAGLLIPYAMLLVPALGLFAGFALSLAGAGALILEAAGRKAGPVPPPLTAN